MQLLASALGGYLAGRLRTRWVTVHTDEVFFRDTAHGFLAWAVATLLMATLLSSAIGTAISTGLKAGGEVAKSAVTVAGAGAAAATSSEDSGNANPLGYFVDSLFRGHGPRGACRRDPANAAPAPAAPQPRLRSLTAFRRSRASSRMRWSPVSLRRRTGNTWVSSWRRKPACRQGEAEQRVTDTFARLKQNLEQAAAKAKQVADDARKASAALALWLVVSLFVGAFVASFAATFGGRLRDSSVLAKT